MLIIRPKLNRHRQRVGAEGLRQHGLAVSVALRVQDKLAAKLREEGKPVPDPVFGLALIDTGASTTSIDESAAKKLALPSHGKRKVLTTHGSRVVPTYDFAGTLGETAEPPKKARGKNRPGDDLLKFSVQGIECDLGQVATEDVILLVGMDILSECVLIVNGPTGFFTLSH